MINCWDMARRSRPWFSESELKQLFDEHARGSADHGKRLYALSHAGGLGARCHGLRIQLCRTSRRCVALPIAGERRIERTALSHGGTRAAWPLLAILALTIARLAFAALVYARPELALQNDTDRYVPIARGILSGQAYTWNTDRPGELLNTVGYPLFLAGVLPVGGKRPGTVAIAQLLLSGALAVGLYLGLRSSVGRAAALAAAVILAMDPLTILWSLTILTETLFAAFLGFAALLLIRWSASRHARTLVLSGFCLGLATMVKPYALLILAGWAAAIVAVLLGRRLSRSWGRACGHCDWQGSSSFPPSSWQRHGSSGTPCCGIAPACRRWTG